MQEKRLRQSMLVPVTRRSSGFGRQSQVRTSAGGSYQMKASLGSSFQTRDSGLGIETNRFSYTTDSRDSMMSRISEVISYGSDQSVTESDDDLPTEKKMYSHRGE